MRVLGPRTVVQVDLDRAAAALVDPIAAEQTMRRTLETEHVSADAPEVVLRTAPLGVEAARVIGIPARDGTLVPARELMTFDDDAAAVPASVYGTSGESVAFVLVSGVTSGILRNVARSVGPHARATVTGRRSLRGGDLALLDLAVEAAGPSEMVIGPARHTGWRTPNTSAGPSPPGTVVVMTPGGWASVYDENGRFLGQTPLRASMPPGPHQLSLRPYGQAPATRMTIIVQPAMQSRVIVPVEPQRPY